MQESHSAGIRWSSVHNAHVFNSFVLVSFWLGYQTLKHLKFCLIELEGYHQDPSLISPTFLDFIAHCKGAVYSDI